MYRYLPTSSKIVFFLLVGISIFPVQIQFKHKYQVLCQEMKAGKNVAESLCLIMISVTLVTPFHLLYSTVSTNRLTPRQLAAEICGVASKNISFWCLHYMWGQLRKITIPNYPANRKARSI